MHGLARIQTGILLNRPGRQLCFDTPLTNLLSQRTGVPVHLRRRMARKMAVSASMQAFGAAFAEADVRRRAAMLGGDVTDAQAARSGAAAGEAVALTFLNLGRHVSAGLHRLQAQFNGRAS